MRTRALIPLLNVADVAASLGWYAHLGFEEMQRLERDGAPVWALAGNGTQRLMLHRQDRSGAVERRGRPPHGDVVLCLAVDDAHAARAALAAAGLAPGPMQRQPYGVEQFALRDPDGHELAVSSEPMQVA